MVLAVQTTKSMKVLSNPMFCGSEGKRTIFVITLTQSQVRIDFPTLSPLFPDVVLARQARDITRYSLIASEDEVLLPPGCRFRVESVLPQGGDLTLIQLTELPSEEWILDLSPGEESSKAMLSAASSEADAQDAGGAIAAAQSTGDAPPECCAFFSLRFNDVIPPMAKQLQAALKPKGIEAKIIDMKASGNIKQEVFSQIEACDTFVAFGSKDYGQDTGNSASTYRESMYVENLPQSEQKTIIRIRMIPFDESFAHMQGRTFFGMNDLELPWMVGEPMPADLPGKIAEAMGQAAAERKRADEQMKALWLAIDADRSGFLDAKDFGAFMKKGA